MSVRVLFCMGVLPPLFEADEHERQQAMDALPVAFEDLGEKFGISVLGTFDDDRLMVGPSSVWPWTCYILADAPDVDAAVHVCNLLRETEVGEYRLWRYMRIEARIGRELFFGNA